MGEIERGGFNQACRLVMAPGEGLSNAEVLKNVGFPPAVRVEIRWDSHFILLLLTVTNSTQSAATSPSSRKAVSISQVSEFSIDQ